MIKFSEACRFSSRKGVQVLDYPVQDIFINFVPFLKSNYFCLKQQTQPPFRTPTRFRKTMEMEKAIAKATESETDNVETDEDISSDGEDEVKFEGENNSYTIMNLMSLMDRLNNIACCKTCGENIRLDELTSARQGLGKNYNFDASTWTAAHTQHHLIPRRNRLVFSQKTTGKKSAFLRCACGLNDKISLCMNSIFWTSGPLSSASLRHPPFTRGVNHFNIQRTRFLFF